MKRVVTALIGIPLILYLILFTPPITLIGVVFIFMLLGMYEYFALVKSRIPFLLQISGYPIAAAVLLSFYPDVGQIPAFFFPVSVAWVLTFALLARTDMKTAFEGSALTLFGAWYVGGLMGYLVGLRMITNGGETGAKLVLFLLIVIWTGDTFAYFAGKGFGKHKLAPVVSPKKTVEGALVGLLFSMIAAVVCSLTFLPQLTPLQASIAGMVVGISGQIGDLCESIIKRAVQVKDSGTIIPGHGGVLDRVDSLLFGAPALYYYFYFLQ